MNEKTLQTRLGIYFAGINVVSLVLGGLTGFLVNVKAGIAAFLISLILTTIIVQGYARRKLEHGKKAQDTIEKDQ